MLRGKRASSSRGFRNSARGSGNPVRGESNSSRGLGSSFRGSWRGRGTGWHRGKYKACKGAVEVDAPLGRLITVFGSGDATSFDTSAADARITNCKHAASYSLTDTKRAKILVPGHPAAWKPQELPAQLPGDRGRFFRDHNGARFPDHPMQPSVQAVFAMNKAFDPSSIDIMGCANSLGDILRSTRSIDWTFRFDVEMVGNTLFLVRNNEDQIIADVRGYAHSFLDNFTSYGADMEETKSHQRIISYDSAGLGCLVRFECDGHIPAHVNDSASFIEPQALNIADLSSLGSIKVQDAGRVVPQESIIEIKTLSQARGQVVKSDHLPRLWMRQIPAFINAYHARGSFEDVQKLTLQHDLREWEDEHQFDFQRFALVLRQLVTEVKRASHLKLELCRTGTGPLQQREQRGEMREALPTHWKGIRAGQHDQHPDHAGQERLNSDDDEGGDGTYPLSTSATDACDGSDDSDEEPLFDYTACGLHCGYCGRCV